MRKAPFPRLHIPIRQIVSGQKGKIPVKGPLSDLGFENGYGDFRIGEVSRRL
jgi:hypothetical protein